MAVQSGDDLPRVRAAALTALRQQGRAPAWSTDAARLVAVHFGVAATVVVAWTQLARAGLLLHPVRLALLLALITGASVVAVRPGSRRAQRAVIALAATCALALLASAWGRRSDLPFFADAGCALAELAVALGPAAATIASLRRFAYQPRRAWLGGLAAGATGVLVLDLTCVVGSASHVLAFHLAPGALVACALVAARSRLTSRTFAP